MKCEYCKAETKLKKVKKQHWFKGHLYIIENVDAQVCPKCGERYFHATVLDSIDRMISGKHPVKETLSVEVVAA